MQVWAIANQKGGVGKTTTTLCLSRGLAELGHRVLVVDMDPHGSITCAFRVPSDPPPAGTHELFNGQSVAEIAHATPLANIHLIAAQPAMATLERRSATQPGLGLALERALQAAKDDYDYVLLDCPPTLSLLLVNALAACDRLIVPSQTDPLAIHGLQGMMHTAAMVERSRGRPMLRQVLPTLFDRRTKSGQHVLEQMQTLYGDAICSTPIPLDTRLRDADMLASKEHLYGRGLMAYEHALQWLLDTAPAAREAA
ncbi:MAG: ParA family protein [Thermomonas sp.]|uniref:ParA family protein n=1 Tax=Thermomonas sp. TaxID=1971895 RepID=UPI001EC5CF86|nr:ParA family protein [Thermomonas sp.]MBV2210367.1 ParA family protein [Thermomonas sp.]